MNPSLLLPPMGAEGFSLLEGQFLHPQFQAKGLGASGKMS